MNPYYFTTRWACWNVLIFCHAKCNTRLLSTEPLDHAWSQTKQHHEVVILSSSLLQLILPHMVDHTFIAFHVPLQTLWTPWTNIVPLMFPRSSLKTPVICCTWLLIPFSSIYVDFTPKPAYIKMCAKGQMFLDFSFMWIQVTCLLAFHYPIEALYKEPFGYIIEGGIGEKENYSPLLS